MTKQKTEIEQMEEWLYSAHNAGGADYTLALRKARKLLKAERERCVEQAPSEYPYPSFPSDIDQVIMSAAAAIANLATIAGKRSRRRELIAISECEKILKYAKIINMHLRHQPLTCKDR